MLAIAVLALVSFGVVMVYSASSARALLDEADPMSLARRQAIYAAIGLGAFLVCSRLDVRRLRHLAPLLLGVAIVLNIAVMVPGIGTVANGARQWIVVGPLQFQPSELAKVALVLWIAAFAARNPLRVQRPEGVRPALLVAGFMLLLVVVADLGTAVVLAAGALAALLVAGAPGRTLLLSIGAGATAAVLAVVAQPYRKERLLAFMDPWADPTGSGFQTVQAQIALGSGGWHGVGLGDGLQKVFYLPEAHTDMIIATVGEELGLLGVVAVIALVCLVVVSGYRIALRARDLFQQVLAAGLTTLVAVQAVVNLGAVLGMLPVTGVPLPFVSYGGSSLVVFCAAAGILVRIGRQSHAARLTVVAGRAEGGDRGRGDGRPRHARARAG